MDLHVSTASYKRFGSCVDRGKAIADQDIASSWRIIAGVEIGGGGAGPDSWRSFCWGFGGLFL